MSHRRSMYTDRVLVTGAAGPAAVSVMRGIDREPVLLFAADVDPYAPGLYRVAPEQRLLLPGAGDPTFADALLAACRSRAISVLIPTRPSELSVIATRAEEFAEIGVRLMLAPLPALGRSLDRTRTRELLADLMPVVPTSVLTGDLEANDVRFPATVIARRLDDPTPPFIASGAGDLEALPVDGRLIVETPVDGLEESVDVLRIDGRLISAVPRACLRRERGVAVTSRTMHDPVLEERAGKACEALGIEGIATVRFRRDVGEPHLAEVAPFIPGSIALTVAAGVNMPALWLRSVLGRGGVSPITDFDEVAMARTLLDQIVPVDEVSGTARGATETVGSIAA